MRILMITQLFQPEPNHLKGLAFAKELSALGHDVEVLTGFPNYPGGKIYPGYRNRLFQTEVLDGIKITRVPVFPNHSGSGFGRILCYLSLALTACVPALFFLKKPSVVHVYQGPATLALPAILMRLFRGVPYVLDIQDLWPESVTSSGMLSVPGAERVLHMWCDLAHRLATKIVVLSPGYKAALTCRGIDGSRIDVVYNWCDETPSSVDSTATLQDPPWGRDRFAVVYAGNLGRVQALDAVLEAAGSVNTACSNAIFVFIGDGIDGERLRSVVAERQLGNVLFIPRQPISKIGAIMQQADALLIHLRDDPLCRIGIPQKTQAYLAAGKPIIVAVKGDAAALVQEAGAGVACEPQNPSSIASAATHLLRLSSAAREAMGRNGRNFYETKLSFAVGTKRMESVFYEAVKWNDLRHN